MGKIILFFFVSFFLISCQSLKDGLTGVKRNNSDEFLIEKKNPLTEPPEYGKLPTPENKNETQKNTSSNEIEELLKKNKSTKSNDKSNSNTSSIEELILEKIKN